MRFTLVDQILECTPGERITTVKNLTLAEEYLDDHFPRFPVMPGVLMLEAMTQAAAWLIRITDDFADSMVTLQEARNIKYARFVRPSEALTIRATIKKRHPHQTDLQVEGSVAGELAVSGRVTLDHYNIADQRPIMAITDTELKEKLRQQLCLLWPTRPLKPVS
jgi:3-hydroxyacyl-[acyl-carrier-protein] dehydratase